MDDMMVYCATLPAHIAEIKTYTGGKNHCPLQLTQGYSHGLTMTFVDEPSRIKYVNDPYHQELIRSIAGLVNDKEGGVLVVAYNT